MRKAYSALALAVAVAVSACAGKTRTDTAVGPPPWGTSTLGFMAFSLPASPDGQATPTC